MRISAPIRRTEFKGLPLAVLRQLNQFARDVEHAFSLMLAIDIVLFTGVYTEPMFVGFDHEPQMCIAGRVRSSTAPETAISGLGTSVQFVWEQPQARLRVTKIDGLTVGTEYRFAFLMVG